MNISNVIREQRNKMSMSQEELAERIYVSRQTISSWENGKTYPDINSLVILSEVFSITIDNLIKGDLEIMEQKIEQADIREYKRYNTLMIVCMAIVGILLPASLHLGFIPGVVMAIIIAVGSLYFEFKVKRIKKLYDVQTYREIVAFTKGETLDEIAKIRESGKRGYQKVISFISYALLGMFAALLIFWIIGLFTT